MKCSWTHNKATNLGKKHAYVTERKERVGVKEIKQATPQNLICCPLSLLRCQLAVLKSWGRGHELNSTLSG